MKKFILLIVAGLWSAAMMAQQPVLEPKVKIIESGTATIYWDNCNGVYRDTYRLVVSPEEQTGNPEYWKGMKYTHDTCYVVENLIAGHTYHVYLQGIIGNEIQDWVHTSFVDGEITECEMSIAMSANLNNWGEYGFNIIEEDGQSTFITMTSGPTETTTYRPKGPIKIVGVKGWISNPTGLYCAIYDADGKMVLEIHNSEFCASDFHGKVLYEGVPCPSKCKATVSELDAIVNGANYSVNWSATDAERFEVAVLRQSLLTNRDKDDAAVLVDRTNYSFAGEPYAGYWVSVRPICADGERGNWETMMVNGGWTRSEEVMSVTAKPITLDYMRSGDIMVDGSMGQDGYDYLPALTYSLDLADSTDVGILFRSDDVKNIMYGVYQEEHPGAAWTTIVEGVATGMSGYWNDTLRLTGKIYIAISSLDQTLGNYSINLYAVRPLLPKTIELGYEETSDFTDGTLWEVPYFAVVPVKAYRFTTPDSMSVSLQITTPDAANPSSNPTVMYIVYRDSISEGFDNVIDVRAATGGSLQMNCKKDSTYYVVLFPYSMGGESSPTERYTLSLNVSPSQGNVITTTPKEITALDYTDKSNYSDAETFQVWGTELAMVRVYSITRPVETDVMMWFESPDYNSDLGSMGYCLFRSSIDEDHYIEYENCKATIEATLEKDSTYYIVLYSYPDYGGKATDRYTFCVYDMDHPAQVATIPITPDAYIDDSIHAEFVPTLGYLAIVYDYVATRDTKIAISIENLGDPMLNYQLSMYIFEDELDWNSSVWGVYATDDEQRTLDITGTESGKHYYLAVLNDQQLPYRLILRERVDYDYLPAKGQLDIGWAYRSALSVRDGFSEHESNCNLYWEGACETYLVRLDGYGGHAVMMHKLAAEGPYAANYYKGLTTTFFNSTDTHNGSYEQNQLVSECNSSLQSDWIVLFVGGSADEYPIMFEAEFDSRHMEDSIVYEFSVDKYQPFEDWSPWVPRIDAQMLPLAENGVLKSNVKVMWCDSCGFHANPQDYVSERGIYDAIGRRVRVAPGEDLIVRFVGDGDVSIQFYDSTGLHLLATTDDIPYSFPCEDATYTNQSTDSVDIVVVCSYNQVRIEDAPYGLQMSTNRADLEPEILTAKAEQESVTIYESDGMLEAMDALSQVHINAVDANDQVVLALVNNRFGWVVDLTQGVGLYELNNQDLGLGYKFDFGQEIISVDILRVPDPIDPTGFFPGIESEDNGARKVLYNGQVYIIRDGAVYTVMGQRVK